MKKLITISIIFLIIVGGGIYLNTLNGENIKEKLGLSEIEEEQKPKELEESEEEQRIWELEKRRRKEAQVPDE